MEYIRIRGARTHNLKNINLDLPRHRLIVITGLSGSGKSSLAFDTLYAEGQRRYVESLSAYARQFLQLMEKPDVDLIEGLSPAISIEQKATSHNPRSTVGTVTEIHDYLRLLYARVGEPYCPDHPEQKLMAMTISQMVDAVLMMPEETKLMILSPAVVNRKGEQAELFVELRAKGFVRVRIDGTVYEIDATPRLTKNQKHTVEVVVDRLRVRQDLKQRIAESFETALRHGDGRAIAVEMDSGEEHLYSAKFACPICSYSLQELEPRLFSFNNPMGRLPALRRSRLDQLLRPQACRRISAAVARVRRDQGLGPPQPVLFSDAAESRQALRIRPGEAVQQALRSHPANDPLRQRKGEDRVSVSLRSRQDHCSRARLRGHHSQSRAPLSRDRLDHGPRGAGQVPELEAVPRVRRHAPQTRGASRQGRTGRQRARDFRGQQLAAEADRRVSFAG